MKIQDITSVIETLAPLGYQEAYDNAGLNVGNLNDEVESALVCLDCTEEVVDEAISIGADLIIAHHPLIFGGIKQVSSSDWLGRILIKAIKHNISIYAVHTNLDNVINGVNTKICEKIGLINTKILAPKPGMDNVGDGMIGELKQEMLLDDLLDLLKNDFKAKGIRYTEIIKEKVRKIAVCGGSGSFLLSDAIAENADVFITGDFKYHQFFDANNEIVIIDIGHYESEQYTKSLLYEFLSKKIPNFAIVLSGINTNPVNYF